MVDLSMSKRIRHGMDFNFAIDNLNNKRYWETQNYLESRVSPARSGNRAFAWHAGIPDWVHCGDDIQVRET